VSPMRMAATAMMAMRMMARGLIGSAFLLALGSVGGGPTGVPQTAQNFASSSSLAPHFQQ